MLTDVVVRQAKATGKSYEIVDSDGFYLNISAIGGKARTHYPEHLPVFLFSRSKRMMFPYFTLGTGWTILLEWHVLQALLDHSWHEMREQQEQHEILLKQSAVLLASRQCMISDRAETTYLNINGGRRMLG